MKRLKEQQHFLKAIENLNLKQRKYVLKYLSKDQLKLFIELAFNLLHNNIPISDEQREKIKKKQTIYKKIKKISMYIC